MCALYEKKYCAPNLFIEHNEYAGQCPSREWFGGDMEAVLNSIRVGSQLNGRLNEYMCLKIIHQYSPHLYKV